MFLETLAVLWYDLWLILSTYSLLKDFFDLDSALLLETLIPVSAVKPCEDALCNPVGLSGSAEKASLLDLEPAGLLIKALCFLVRAHKTQFGYFIPTP